MKMKLKIFSCFVVIERQVQNPSWSKIVFLFPFMSILPARTFFFISYFIQLCMSMSKTFCQFKKRWELSLHENFYFCSPTFSSRRFLIKNHHHQTLRKNFLFSAFLSLSLYSHFSRSFFLIMNIFSLNFLLLFFGVGKSFLIRVKSRLADNFITS